MHNHLTITGLELPVEQLREPVYRHSEEVVGQMFDELQLDALPDLEIPAPRHRRRPRGLIIDERTMLTHDEMVNHMQDVNDIIRTREELQIEILRPELPPLSVLFDPLPKGMSEELRPLFETVLKDIHERPVTFQEAQRMTDDDFAIRRFDVEVASWRSTPIEARLSMTQREEMSELVPPPPVEIVCQKISISEPIMPPPVEEVPQRQKVSVFEEILQTELDVELAPPRPSTPLETERMRRETLQRTLSGREPKVSSVVDESLVQQPLELSLMEYPREEFETAIGIHDITLPRESIFEKASPEVEEEDWVDVEMDELYNRILSKQGEATFTNFDEVIEEVKGDRKRVARKFFTILKLLKHGKIKARQIEAYGRIQLRIANVK